jgi:hypothetical protein
MTDIYIGGTKQKLLAELRVAINTIEEQPEGMVSATIYGKANSTVSDSEMNIIFSDEDMDRPEVADVILVDVEA